MAINQLFEQFLGGNQTGQPSPAGNLAAKVPTGLVGGLAAGGLLGLIAGNKKVRKTAGKMAIGAAGVGGTIALSALAYKAYQGWQAKGKAEPQQTTGHAQVQNGSAWPGASPVTETPSQEFDLEDRIGTDGKPFEFTLVKAMIAAANADGHIDKTEMARIFDEVEKFGLEPEDKALVFDTLRNPPDIMDICRLADGIEHATQIYLVSRLAIDPDDPREQAYLRQLAKGLSLPNELVLELNARLEHTHQMAA